MTTPPNLASTAAFRGIWPAWLLVKTFFPQIVLCLPQTMGYKGG